MSREDNKYSHLEGKEYSHQQGDKMDSRLDNEYSRQQEIKIDSEYSRQQEAKRDRRRDNKCGHQKRGPRRHRPGKRIVK
jgi:hypothetical protein